MKVETWERKRVQWVPGEKAAIDMEIGELGETAGEESWTETEEASGTGTGMELTQLASWRMRIGNIRRTRRSFIFIGIFFCPRRHQLR